jgi:hypothetical protein
MRQAVEMGSGAKIYVSSFIKIGLIWEDTQTHRQHGDHISLL